MKKLHFRLREIFTPKVVSNFKLFQQAIWDIVFFFWNSPEEMKESCLLIPDKIHLYCSKINGKSKNDILEKPVE